jgi:radical SAM/Cys-rich protein
MHNTWPRLRESTFPAIARAKLDTVQINLGYLCNISCIHCHVNAGPRRKELMDRDTMELALEFARRHGVRTLDLTGGSPEMNPHFGWLVESARGEGMHVMDRLNPTIIEEPGYEWVAEFLALHRIEAVASLPCYTAKNVDTQRGPGVFERSIRALQKLNALGYGREGTGLELNLVYNPGGAFLPPRRKTRTGLQAPAHGEHGIAFNKLFTITNMPIKRFGSWLISKGKFDDYMTLLKDSYRPRTSTA